MVRDEAGYCLIMGVGCMSVDHSKEKRVEGVNKVFEPLHLVIELGDFFL